MAPSAKPTRYSKTSELDRCYGSVFSNLSETTRHALLIQLKRPEFLGNTAKQKAITETRRDEIKTLVELLRKEPLEYFRRALERARKTFEESEYEELKNMLSIRETELNYEKGEFDENNFNQKFLILRWET